jgi:hypothetical protein
MLAVIVNIFSRRASLRAVSGGNFMHSMMSYNCFESIVIHWEVMTYKNLLQLPCGSASYPPGSLAGRDSRGREQAQVGVELIRVDATVDRTIFTCR